MASVRFVASLVVIVSTFALGASGLAPLPAEEDGPTQQYVAAGVAVAKEARVDNGFVICQPRGPSSFGGGCIPFGPYKYLSVKDAALGKNVAFQVCIDNNGDGVCGGNESTSDRCGDDVYFSHDDRGRFFNPIGPLPGGFRWGCTPSGGFRGYVVFICSGSHLAGGPHAHSATSGTISPAPIGSGFGNFCLPFPQPPQKRYVVLEAGSPAIIDLPSLPG